MGFENSLVSSFEIHFKSSKQHETFEKQESRVYLIVVLDKTRGLNVAVPIYVSNINIMNNSLQNLNR